MATSLKPEMRALSDPVQAALLKAAQRKQRCAKPKDPETDEGLRSLRVAWDVVTDVWCNHYPKLSQ